MKLEFSRQSFEKYSSIRFHENPSSGSPVVPYRQTDRRTHMTKLIVAFRNFVNAPKNSNSETYERAHRTNAAQGHCSPRKFGDDATKQKSRWNFIHGRSFVMGTSEFPAQLLRKAITKDYAMSMHGQNKAIAYWRVLLSKIAEICTVVVGKR